MSSNLRLLLAIMIAVLLTVLLGGVLNLPWLLAAPLGFGSLFLSYNMIRPNPRRLASRAEAKQLEAYPQFRGMLNDAKEDLAYLEEARRLEREPEVRKEIEKLLATGEKITNYLSEHPERISSAHRFFTYYLETAVSVMKQLASLRETGLKHHEVEAGKRKAIETLPRLHEAFEAQYTKLISGDLIALEVEAKLLETSMRMDGFKVKTMETKRIDADTTAAGTGSGADAPDPVQLSVNKEDEPEADQLTDDAPSALQSGIRSPDQNPPADEDLKAAHPDEAGETPPTDRP